MPTLKSLITILDTIGGGVPLSGGAGPTTTGFAEIPTQYGGIFYVTVTNHASLRSKLPLVVQAQVAGAKTVADSVPFDCRHVAKQEAGAVTKFAIRIPTEVPYANLEITHSDVAVDVVAKFGRLDSV
jgi:hypothetical protein